MFDRYSEIQARRAANDSQESGFTLIELLIVIVVLGILAAIVIFSLTGVTASSAASACNADAKTVEVAVQAYNAQVGNFPTAVPVTDTPSATTAGLVPAYLHTWPSNGTHYSITLGASGVVTVTAGGATGPYDSQTATTGCNAAK